MDESEENMITESWIKVDNNLSVKMKPKKRSLVERELETNLTARVTSPVTIGDGTSTSRYGRARRLKTESELSDSRKIMLEVLKSTPPEKSPGKLQSPVYKMHASNSPIRTVSPKRAPVETFLENQIENIYQENKSLSRFTTDEITKNSPCKNKKIYIQKDLIQNRQPEDAVVLIKSIFSPVKGSDKKRNTHLNNILERSSDKFSLITKDSSHNGYIANSSVVKTLDFDNKKKKKENKDIKYVSKSDLFEVEAKCMYQVGDLAWSRMGTYPFWPCIVTRDPTSGIYVKKKLFGRIERDIIHVTFFGDNGRRGWILDSMLRKFMGLAEFEATRDRFTAEDKKKDPKLYAAFFISDKKQALWHISVEEAEILLREPKRLRIELLNDILENSSSYKINPKMQKSGKVTRTDSDVSLSESLYDTLFSEDDGKTDDSERSKNKSRNKSLDVSEVVTACLDNMAAKTGITKIQRQSHMDRWLQKAKSSTPEKAQVKVQVPKIVADKKKYNHKKKKLNREIKPYNLRKTSNESHNLLAYHNEHDYSKFVSDDDNSSIKTNISDGNIESKYEFVPLEESGAGIGIITKIESLADNKEQRNKAHTLKTDERIIISNKHAREAVFDNGALKLTEDKMKSIETDQSDNLNIVLANEIDRNDDYNRDDQQISECAILKENTCDTNGIDADSMLNNSSCLQNSGLDSVTENPEASNENPMEIGNINNDDIHNSDSVLDNNNLSINENHVSIVDSEKSIDDKNFDLSTKSPNLYSEESNVIPIKNDISFKNENSNDPDVTNIPFEKETTVKEGDNNFLDLKLSQKNNCDEVNINTQDFLLYQTENTFLHSIKSTYEDKLEDTNNISTNNLSEETKMTTGNNLNIPPKENIVNNGDMYENNKILNDIEITKSSHLDKQCNNSEDKNVPDQIMVIGELRENYIGIQEAKKDNKDSIDQAINESISVVVNKRISNSLDDNEDNGIVSQKCHYNNLIQNDSADSYKSVNAHVMLTDIDHQKESNIKDTNCEEKNYMIADESLNINGFKETTIRKNILVDCNERMDSTLTLPNNKITLKKDSLGNLQDNICIEKNKMDTEKSPQSLNINGFQETDTNNLENNDNIDNTLIDSRISDVLTNKKMCQLQSEYKQIRINELDNPEFLKYLELRQDVVMDEHPELNEDNIITYLYQTWLYEESRKSDLKKVDNLEESSSVKGLDPTPKKRSRRLKRINTENNKKKTIVKENKDSNSDSATSESNQNFATNDLRSKWPVILGKKRLSLQRNNNKKKPLPVGDLSDTEKDNAILNVSETTETSSELRCNTEMEITTTSKCDTVIHNVHKKESKIIYVSEDNIHKDKFHPILFNLLSDLSSDTVDNVSDITNEIEDLQDETASLDSEANDVPLIHQKLQLQSIDNVSNENKDSKSSIEEFESNESFDSINSETNLIKSEQEHKSLKDKREESESNHESFSHSDSETRLSESKQETKHESATVSRLDESLETNKEENMNGEDKNGYLNEVKVNLDTNFIKPVESPKPKKEESESNNESFSSTDSETILTKPKQETKHERESINKLDESLDSNKEEIDYNNGSLNIVNMEIILNKPKQKSKYKKTNNPFDDPEFKKYQELRQDALLEENPQLTQEEITNYLYKTWLYEENSKSDFVKTDIIAQSGLVKGLEQDIVQPKKIKKKVKVPKEITDYFQISPKEKPKRKSIKPFYNEEYYDIDDEIEPFEVNRDSDCNSTLRTDVEHKQGDDKPPEGNQDIYQIEEVEEIDEAEIYFSELTKPKPNIFKGLLREKVCEICEKTSNLVKCKTCHGMFHVDCVRSQSKVVEISTPIRGRKKKKRISRKQKNSEDSEGHSDDKQDLSEENNISIEEIEAESITVDAVTLEMQLCEKMKELLENAEAVNYDSYSSDNELDWNDTIAGKCKIVDVQLKRKSFDSYVDYSDFKCSNCLKYDIPVCFVCKSEISKKESKIRQRCHVAHCHRYYHLECLDHWPQTQFNAGEPSKYNKKVNEHFESLTCPRHVCHTCVSDDPRGCKTRFSGDKLARCIRCPATYHTFTKCVPAGSQILSASHIICPRHYKHRPGKVPCHVNTGWCFICALGGSLICCEYCPTSFHAECLNIDPPEGGYMCEDCETGRLPLYGEMVWVKLGHYRWWPGLILHPSEIPNNIMSVKHSPGEFVVRFFGQYDYYWVNRGRVFPFQEGDSGRVSSQRSKIDAAFTTAMEHAQRACEILKSALPNEEESMDIASSLLPPHYVKLRVNKPCGSLCGRKLDDPELSLTQCDCNPDEEDPCGPYSQCLNRMLLTECGPSCRAGDRCNNRAFEKRLYPKLVPYRTPHRGWGLKTLEDIKAGQFVIEYVGELIDEEEFKRRMRRKHEIRDENFYFLTLDKERMIDAGPKGNLARFMNHCCEPNCETQKWTVLGDVRVGLFTLYDIPANSEVTFNYNLESAGIEKKRCFCGAKRCSGYIGAKPKQDESQSKKGKVPVKRTYKKRKVEESPSTGKTKTKRLGRPPKPKELSEIEKDLLIIRNATNGISSDESTRSLSSEGERLPKPLKRKRVSFSAEEIIHYERPESPSLKKLKHNEKDVGD